MTTEDTPRLLHDAGGGPDAEPSELERARAILRHRTSRTTAFAPVRSLFHDPAWDIMLTLFIAQEEDFALSLADLCATVGLNHGSTRRWLMALEQKGMIHSWPPEIDYDSRSAGLTPYANTMMLRFLDET